MACARHEKNGLRSARKVKKTRPRCSVTGAALYRDDEQKNRNRDSGNRRFVSRAGGSGDRWGLARRSDRDLKNTSGKYDNFGSWGVEETMVQRLIPCSVLAAIAGAAIAVAVSSSPSLAFTLSSPSLAEPATKADVQRVWYHHYYHHHYYHHYY
jgi:hypothetical protein